MPRKPDISGLQIMCQYQIPALLAGVNPAVVFSQAYEAECRAHAQSSPSEKYPTPGAPFDEPLRVNCGEADDGTGWL
jgi:hypothetical protein